MHCVRPVPTAAPLHPWPSTPWSRLHIDFASPFMGQMFMVLVNAHSKWMEVHIMSNITSQKTIEVLRGIFSIHGLPRTLVSVPDLLARSLRYLLILNTSSLHRTIHLLMD